MRSSRSPRLLGVLLGCAFGSCNPSDRVAAPGLQADIATLPPVRISEIHYDNTGTDAGEAIEVSGPAGVDLGGWQLVLYDGNGGGPYTTTDLTGSIPPTCDPRGVVVVDYPVNGIQNGSPDGVALVSPGGVGVTEAGSEPVGQSLQRSGSPTAMRSRTRGPSATARRRRARSSRTPTRRPVRTACK